MTANSQIKGTGLTMNTAGFPRSGVTEFPNHPVLMSIPGSPGMIQSGL